MRRLAITQTPMGNHQLTLLWKPLNWANNNNDVDRLYVSRKEGGRGLTSIEDRVDSSIQQLEDYIEMRRGRLISAIINNADNTWIDRTEISRKQKWEEKQLYGHFKRLTSDISHKKTCVIYWPSTEPSIKRCTCVNKRKNSGSRWTLENNITRCRGGSSQLETGCRSENQLADWGLCGPQWPPVEQPKPRCKRSAAMVEEELGSI